MPEIAPGIEVSPDRCSGRPVIRNTRVPVKTVLDALAAGDTLEQVATDYGITHDDIRNAIAFANTLVDEWEFVPTRG